MKLEIKHLTPYLPYNLRLTKEDWGKIGKLVPFVKQDFKGLQIEIDYALSTKAKPILRPLSDLTKEDFKEELYQYYQTLGIDVKLVNYDSGNDNPFDITLTVTYKMMGEVYTDCLINRGSTSETPYHIIVWLCENHFDLFGLIEKGLAIDINNLKH